MLASLPFKQNRLTKHDTLLNASFPAVMHQHETNNLVMSGHRQHAMYMGFHVPGGYRRRGHHHRRHHQGHRHEKKKSEDGETRPVTPPSERVHFILGEDDQDGLHVSHPLFSELEELVSTEEGEFEWRERARYAIADFQWSSL